uniref:C2H2-type domain-containing protein n=1 Tax=viral metagenome TaxID=1070528 RepID=A0A6C0I8N8_9ZZZZ
MSSSIQLTVDNKTFNISINIAELLSKGAINITLNNVPEERPIPVAEAKIINDTTNVTFRKPNPSKKSKPVILIEEPLQLCKEKEDEKKKKYISHTYEKDEHGLLKCPYCDCKKKNLSTISMHVTANHASEMGKEVNPHKCDYPDCGKSFPIKTRLFHHIKNHHQVESLCCPFPNCEYMDSKNKATLYTHYVRKHMNYETMCSGTVCNTCNSDKNTGIIYHLATCHPASPFCKVINII